MGRKLASLDERVSTVEKKEDSSDGSSIVKIDIDLLEMEVASLKSTDINAFWDALDVPPKVDINMVLEVQQGLKAMKKMTYLIHLRPMRKPWEMTPARQSLMS